MTKRRPKPGEPATSNTRLVLKHRSLTAREHRMFRQRERQLEPANQAEEEDEIEEEEEEEDDDEGQRLTKEPEGGLKDVESDDAQSDRSRSRSPNNKSASSAASSSRSRSSSAASSRRSASPAAAAPVAQTRKYYHSLIINILQDKLQSFL